LQLRYHPCLQADLAGAVSVLQREISALETAYSGLSSGCVRVEVPLPRTTPALQWLAGQERNAAAAAAVNSLPGVQAALLAPRVYFSSRHSSAPDTPLTAQAEAVTRGLLAVAGEATSPCRGVKYIMFQRSTTTATMRFLVL
jgi:hypothetical protein